MATFISNPPDCYLYKGSVHTTHVMLYYYIMSWIFAWNLNFIFNRIKIFSLDVCSHFSPVVAWSCCQPSWPIKRWKCQLRSLAQAQSGISECLLQDWQSGWSPCAWSFSSAVCVEETNRGALAAHSRSFEMPRSRTVQFSRSFVLSCVRLWNGLHETVFTGEGLGAFKTSVNRFLLQGWLPAVSSFSSIVSLSFFLFSGPKIAWGSSDL